MKWELGAKHKWFGVVIAAGIRDGEPYRFFRDKNSSIALIPLELLEEENKIYKGE